MTVQEILRSHVACITCRTGPQPDENTTIDLELIKDIVEGIKEFGERGVILLGLMLKQILSGEVLIIVSHEKVN